MTVASSGSIASVAAFGPTCSEALCARPHGDFHSRIPGMAAGLYAFAADQAGRQLQHSFARES
jgi:hypothetical protein